MWCVGECVLGKCFDVGITIGSPCTHFVFCSHDDLFYIFEFEGLTLGRNIPDFYEIVTAPIMKVCNSLQKVWH